MKLKFILDKSYDLKMIYWMITEYPSKLEEIANRIRIDLELARESQKSDEKKAIKLLKNPVNKKYKILLPYLKKTLKLYQKSWNEINNEFFKTVEEITGYSWKYKNYFCVLSPFLYGISSWGGNKIIRTWQENPYLMSKITAHELLISYIFTIFERDFKKENLTNKEKWALAEISAWALTGLEKKMLKFWPWISEEEKYPLNHDYPQLYELQKKLKWRYEKKKNFKEFLKKSIKIIKKEYMQLT